MQDRRNIKNMSVSALNICIFFVCAYFDIGVLIALFAVLLHETGHICSIILIGKKISHLHFSTLGIEIETDGLKSTYPEDIFVSLSGPSANLFGAALCLFSDSDFCNVFFVCNAFLAIFNLLPISCLDGGRAFYCFLCLKFKLETAEKISRFTSYLFIFILYIICIYFLFYHQTYASLLKMCFYLLITVIFNVK